MIYSSGSVAVAVMEVARRKTSQEVFTASRSQYARPGFPKVVAVHWNRWERKRKNAF